MAACGSLRPRSGAASRRSPPPVVRRDLDGVPMRGSETVVKGHESRGRPCCLRGRGHPHDPEPTRCCRLAVVLESDFLPGNGLASPPDIDRESHFAGTVAEWSAFVTAWCGTNTPIVTYESLWRGEASGLAEALARIGLDVSEDRLRAAVSAETPSVTRASLAKRFGHNTFVRRATVGDWTKHIDASQALRLLDTAADALRLLALTRPRVAFQRSCRRCSCQRPDVDEAGRFDRPHAIIRSKNAGQRLAR